MSRRLDPSSVILLKVINLRHPNNVRKKSYAKGKMHTVRASNYGTTLVRSLLHRAVLAYSLCERTDPQVAHQHSVMTGTVETGLVRHDSVALAVVLEIVVASLHRT